MLALTPERYKKVNVMARPSITTKKHVATQGICMVTIYAIEEEGPLLRQYLVPIRHGTDMKMCSNQSGA